MGPIYLDSCLLIYAIEDHPALGAKVLTALADEPPGRFATSPLAMMECLVKPLRTADLVLQRRYEDALEQLEQLPLPADAYRQAATACPVWIEDSRCIAPRNGTPQAVRV